MLLTFTKPCSTKVRQRSTRSTRIIWGSWMAYRHINQTSICGKINLNICSFPIRVLGLQKHRTTSRTNKSSKLLNDHIMSSRCNCTSQEFAGKKMATIRLERCATFAQIRETILRRKTQTKTKGKCKVRVHKK